MTEQISKYKTIVRNAFMLYLRMFLTMAIGLYTSRVVLNTLGVEDFGIYGLVGSIVAMVGFLNSSMSGATSRFLTYELGKGNEKSLSDTFCSAMVVHIVIAIVIIILAETVGLWLLSYKLVIPEERLFATHIVYQLSIFSVIFSVIQVPYNSCIIAHEKMDFYAYVEILNVILKLIIVYVLLIGNFDKLILYAILMLAVSSFIFIVYYIYCKLNFKEARFHWIWNNEYIRPMLAFSLWNLYYEGAFAIRQQGANFLLNMFCGLAYNAASGIATTVQGIVMGFSSNIVMAFRPQVVKSYAQGNIDSMNRLIRLGTKFASVLILAFTIPIIFRLGYILELWLGNVPPGAIFMLQCLLIVNVFNTASILLVAGIQATGKLKIYSGLCGTIYLLSVAVMYGLMVLGLDYRAIYVVILATAFIVNLAYASILKKQVPEFNFHAYYLHAVAPVAVTATITTALIFCIDQYFPAGFLSLLLFGGTSVLVILVSSFYIVLNNTERQYIIGVVKSRLHIR